jgi:hypothetical protein
MSTQDTPSSKRELTPEEVLNKRLETIGWACFLIMLGGLGLVPNRLVPESAWLVGVGIIMLGLNAARYSKGLRPSSVTTVLGALALISGLGSLFGLDLPVFAIALILIGANLILKPLFEKG